MIVPTIRLTGPLTEDTTVIGLTYEGDARA
jgi:hypothetical protein